MNVKVLLGTHLIAYTVVPVVVGLALIATALLSPAP